MNFVPVSVGGFKIYQTMISTTCEDFLKYFYLGNFLRVILGPALYLKLWHHEILECKHNILYSESSYNHFFTDTFSFKFLIRMTDISNKHYLLYINVTAHCNQSKEIILLIYLWAVLKLDKEMHMLYYDTQTVALLVPSAVQVCKSVFYGCMFGFWSPLRPVFSL